MIPAALALGFIALGVSVALKRAEERVTHFANATHEEHKP